MLILDEIAVSDLAKALRARVASAGTDLKLSHARAVVAAALGFGDPNALSARLAKGPLFVFAHPELSVDGDGPPHSVVLEQLARLMRHEAKRLAPSMPAHPDMVLLGAALSAATALGVLPYPASAHYAASEYVLRFPDRPRIEFVTGPRLTHGDRDVFVLDLVHHEDILVPEKAGFLITEHVQARRSALRGHPGSESARMGAMAVRFGKVTGTIPVIREVEEHWEAIVTEVGLWRGRHLSAQAAEYEFLVRMLDDRAARIAKEHPSPRPLGGAAWTTDEPAWTDRIMYQGFPGPHPRIVDTEAGEFAAFPSFEWGDEETTRDLAAMVVQAAILSGRVLVRNGGGGLARPPRDWMHGGPVVRTP